jgi:hypothetical protein
MHSCITTVTATAFLIIGLGSHSVIDAATSRPNEATLVKKGVYPGSSYVNYSGTTIYEYSNIPLCLGVQGKDYIVINTNGTIKIGKNLSVNADNSVSVNSTLFATEIRVQANPFPDYVFSDDYKLMPLLEVEDAIKRDHHLPGMLPAEDIHKEGLPVSQVVVKQMEKIEELTLYAIALKKENDLLAEQNAALEARVARIEAALAQDH